jgi:hypothetical protein
MDAPQPPQTSTKVRDASVVSIATAVMVVLSILFFNHYTGPPPLTAADNAKEVIGVIAGFWFTIIGGGFWLWRRLQARKHHA